MNPARNHDVTSLGEVMLRMTSEAGIPIQANRSLATSIGGAESNILTALAGLGRSTALHTGLPDNPLGRAVLRELRANGIALDGVIMHNAGKLGLYFVEQRRGPLPGQVTYDRSGSTFSLLEPGEIDWEALLDTRILHLTGITPALSESCLELVAEAIARAKANDVPVSFDVNFRAKLWSPDAARATLTPLLSQVDLLICGMNDARSVFGVEGSADDALNHMCTLTSATCVVVTDGAAGAVASIDGKSYQTAAHDVQIVDPLGAGDAFAAGVLDGWLDGTAETGLERGAYLAAVKLGQAGDSICVNRQELACGLSGRLVDAVQR